jgi:hypothetical protein
MKKTFAVIWDLHGHTHTGKLETLKERLELTSRQCTLSFPRHSVSHYVIERSPDARIRGLPALTIRLVGGEVVRLASLGGVGSLHEIAELVAGADAGARVRNHEVAAGT